MSGILFFIFASCELLKKQERIPIVSLENIIANRYIIGGESNDLPCSQRVQTRQDFIELTVAVVANSPEYFPEIFSRICLFLMLLLLFILPINKVLSATV